MAAQALPGDPTLRSLAKRPGVASFPRPVSVGFFGACPGSGPSYNARMRKYHSIIGSGIAIVVLLAAADALGCPNCKDGVNTSDPQGLNIARGYFYSILLMLAMPFTLAGSFGAYVWREMRRQKRLAESAEPGAAAGRTVS